MKRGLDICSDRDCSIDLRLLVSYLERSKICVVVGDWWDWFIGCWLLVVPLFIGL
jgi:hypothetical protein